MTAYEQGFRDKCTELGVDADAVVKQASFTSLLAKARAALSARGSAGTVPYLLRSGTVARIPTPKGFIEQLLKGKSLTGQTKSIDSLLASTEIGAHAGPSASDFRGQLAALSDAKAQGFGRTKGARTPDAQFDLLRKLIQRQEYAGTGAVRAV